MVRKLVQGGLSDAEVLAAMGQVPRHQFVDSALVTQAYEDTSLPIGLGQTISKPSVVARMIELLRQGALMQADGRMGRVLEIGTGCGYQAAVLSCVSREVYSIERLRGLHDKARDNLRPICCLVTACWATPKGPLMPPSLPPLGVRPCPRPGSSSSRWVAG